MRTGLLKFRTTNIGDDVQSFAVLQHLPAVDMLTEREHLDQIDRPTRLVTNNWFLKKAPRSRWDRLLGRPRGHYIVPSRHLRPVFYGFCLGRPEILDQGWAKYLAAHAPIGCRDTDTVAALTARGIDAHWTGCITTFAGRRLWSAPPEARKDILIVDLDAETESIFVPADVSAGAVRLSNEVEPEDLPDPLTRMAAAAALFERLSTARLVITRRLHVALPCVGLGTPVVVLPDPEISHARWRFSGVERVLPVIFKDETARAGEIDWRDPAPGRPPADMEARHADLLDVLGTPKGVVRRALPGHHIRIANPGLGANPRPLRLAIGGEAHAFRTPAWTASEIEIGLKEFAGRDALRLMLEVGNAKGGFDRVGELAPLVVPAAA